MVQEIGERRQRPPVRGNVRLDVDGERGTVHPLCGCRGLTVPRFAYLAPRTVEEALECLAQHGDGARVLAGGQSLLPLINYRLARPAAVVDINDLPLAGVRAQDGRLTLGALVRHATLAGSPEVASACPILAEAAALVGNVRVRTLGTIGGSLAHADPAAELPMTMVALDARLTLRGRAGTREIAAADFFTGYLSTALGPGELLVEIAVPDTAAMGHAVQEFSRRPGDFALVAVAALVAVDPRGRVNDVRLAFGGVGPAPVRARSAEDWLRGHEPSAERIAGAAERAQQALDPPSDAFASGAYRRLLARVLSRRALGQAVARALGADGDALRRPRPASSVPRSVAGRGGPGLPTDAPAEGDGPVTAGLVINGRVRAIEPAPHRTLLEVLRDDLGILEVKEGCGEGVCGACTVLLDGHPVSSCLVLAASTRGRAITTVRALAGADGELHPLQEAFLRHGAVQCGFCTPGMLLTALAFLVRHPAPSRDEIRHALEGNLCRCTGYTKLVDAIEDYAREARA